MTHRDRYVLCFGAAFVSVSLVAARGAPALAAWAAREQSEATASRRELLRARSLVADLPMLRDSIAAESTRLVALRARVFNTITSAAAASALADVVTDIATNANVKVSTLELHADSIPVAAMIGVAVRLAGTTDVSGLADLLRAIDTSDTLMKVRELVVSQGEPAAPATQAEALRIEVVVVALARIGPRPR